MPFVETIFRMANCFQGLGFKVHSVWPGVGREVERPRRQAPKLQCLRAAILTYHTCPQKNVALNDRELCISSGHALDTL